MPKSTEQSPTTTAPEALPALPAKRSRRRSTRSSHSWRFRRPPSRKRVEVATARGLPETAQTPTQVPDPSPINDSFN